VAEASVSRPYATSSIEAGILKEENMSWNWIILVGVVVGWFVLNRWILPKLGIHT